MKFFGLILIVLLLSGCSKEFKEADGLILCNPLTGKSYFVEHRIGTNSIVEPINTGKNFCIKRGAL